MHLLHPRILVIIFFVLQLPPHFDSSQQRYYLPTSTSIAREYDVIAQLQSNFADQPTSATESSLVQQMISGSSRLASATVTPRYDPLFPGFNPERRMHPAALLAVREHLPSAGITRR